MNICIYNAIDLVPSGGQTATPVLSYKPTWFIVQLISKCSLYAVCITSVEPDPNVDIP